MCDSKIDYEKLSYAIKLLSIEDKIEFGLMYEYGNNVAEDINIAINWFQLAATNGNILASNHLKLLKKPTHSNPKPIVEKIKLTPAVPQNDPLNIRN